MGSYWLRPSGAHCCDRAREGADHDDERPAACLSIDSVHQKGGVKPCQRLSCIQVSAHISRSAVASHDQESMHASMLLVRLCYAPSRRCLHHSNRRRRTRTRHMQRTNRDRERQLGDGLISSARSLADLKRPVTVTGLHSRRSPVGQAAFLRLSFPRRTRDVGPS